MHGFMFIIQMKNQYDVYCLNLLYVYIFFFSRLAPQCYLHNSTYECNEFHCPVILYSKIEDVKDV
jgi:hypothetical protein